MYEFRQYQLDTAKALYEATKEEGCSPVVAVPTAGGKTVIMGLFFKMYLKDNPHDHIVVLSHTKNILQQDYDSLTSVFPELDIGLYSAGLGQKELGQITIAGIQSAINNPKLFMWTNLYLVDEVHGVNAKAVGSYRKLLDPSPAIKTGMSATVFRSGHGYIYKGKGVLFNKLAYDLTSMANFNKLVDDGYLCKLVSVAPENMLDSRNVKKSAGDYNIKHLAEAHDKESITIGAIAEAKKYGKNYKKWLVFAIDIEHADNIAKYLNLAGIKSVALHSRVKGDHAKIINSFTNGGIQALVSVGMITTGFDAPCVDLILLLRPTLSAVLHVQMVGRGLRVFPGKKHCLVLDFAGNISRLGPINDVMIPKESKGDGNGRAPSKTCPVCRTIVHTITKECPSCHHEFKFEVKLTKSFDTAEIVKKSDEPTVKWLNVSRVSYAVQRSAAGRNFVMVRYHCGLTTITEPWCIEYSGYAGTKARHMAQYRGHRGAMTNEGIVRNAAKLKIPLKINVTFGKKYNTINQSAF